MLCSSYFYFKIVLLSKYTIFLGFVNKKILSKPKLYFVSVLTVFWGYFFTLTLQVIFLFPDFTVIVAVPFFFATIFPFEFTAATLELELL